MQPDVKNHAVADGEEDISDSKYLLFHLGSEVYATPLLKVREVIKMASIKPVPYMVPHFKGVINLRGQIVGIVDLRLKFQLKPKAEDRGMILIIDSEQGSVGAIVDEIQSVEKIPPQEISADPMIETKIPTQFFMGVAKLALGLVNLIDISGCLSSEEMRKVKRAA